MGHRGGLLEVVENTMDGVELTVSKEIGLECDVVKTKDGKYILCHDNYLERLTGQKEYVENLNYDEILPILDNLSTCYNNVISPVKNVKKLKPALLIDVLKKVKGTKTMMSVDVKSKKEEDLIEVIKIFQKMGMEENVAFGSFVYYDYEKLKIKHGLKKIAFFGGTRQCQVVIIGFLLGLLPFINTECDIFCLPHYFESIPHTTEFPKLKYKRIQAVIQWILDNTFKYLVRHLKKRGIPVMFWTLNTENDVLKALSLETNGIICDNPQTLLKYQNLKSLYQFYQFKLSIQLNTCLIMIGSVLSIFYRNILQFRMVALILLGLFFITYFFNYLQDIPKNIQASLFLLGFLFYKQLYIVYSMAEDKQSNFRNIYRIMGLSDIGYISGQLISYFFISYLCSYLILFFFSKLSVTLEESENHNPYYIKDLQKILIYIIVQQILLGMMIGSIFKKPKLARDISIFINLFIMQYTFKTIIENQFKNKENKFVVISPYYIFFKFLLSYNLGMGEQSFDFYFNQQEFAHSIIGLITVLFLFEYVQNQQYKDSINQVYDKDKVGLEVLELEQSYKKNKVLNGINFLIEPNQMITLLGHNGAGKSTLFGVILGNIKSQKGEIRWNQIGRDAQQISLGYCPSFNIFIDNLTVKQNLYFKALLNLESRQVVEQILVMMDLKKYENFKVKNLSGGNKRKLMIGISILSCKDLLIMDEPTSEIDPISRQQIWNILKKFKQFNPKLTVFLSTHNLDEADYLSNKVLILAKGKICFNGSPQELKYQYNQGMTVKFYKENFIDFSKQEKEKLKNVIDKIGGTVLQEQKFLIEFKMTKILSQNFEKLQNETQKNDNIHILINSCTLEQSYIELDKQFSVDQESDLQIKDIYETYTNSKITQILQIMKIFMLNFFVSKYEIVKMALQVFVSTYGCQFCFYLIYKYLDQDLTEYLMIFPFILQIFEICFCPFLVQNLINENDLKINVYMKINKVSTIIYYLGKFLCQTLISGIYCLMIYIFIYANYEGELIPQHNLQYLKFKVYVFFVWKIANNSMGLMIHKFFSNKASLVKYYFIVYMVINSIIIYVAEKLHISYITILSDSEIYKDRMDDISGIEMITFYCLLTAFFHFLIAILLTKINLNLDFIWKRLNKEPVKQSKDIQSEGILQFQNVSKDFFRKKALKNVSFSIQPKTYYGLVGENGSGKTTIANIILQQIKQTEGTVKIKEDLASSFSMEKIFQKTNFGVCFQEDTLWMNLTVSQILSFYSKIFNLKSTQKLFKYFEMQPYENFKVYQLSSGNKRKLSLLISLLNKPEIMLMDECTTGIDIGMKEKIKIFLKEYKETYQNCGVFSTHFLKDIEIYCDNLLILVDGELVFNDSIRKLVHQYSCYFVRITFENQIEKSSWLSQQKEIQIILEDERYVELRMFKIQIFNLIIQLLHLKENNKINDFFINQLSLENLYELFIDDLKNKQFQ